MNERAPRALRARLALGAVALATLTARSTHAYGGATGAADPKPATALTLTAAPIFGAEAATGGWTELVLHIDNVSGVAQKGTLELAMVATGSGGASEPTARVPFSVAAGENARVKVPTPAFAVDVPLLTVTAFAERGAKLATASITLNGTRGPLLVDVHQPSRIGVALRGWPIKATWSPSGGGYASSALTVGAPAYDRATGDPVLPDYAAAYASVTALLMSSETLLALDEPAREALEAWVVAGGTLAVCPSRPEDLRAPALATLTGGPIRNAPPEASWLALPVLERPASAAEIGAPPEPGDGEGASAPEAPGGPIQYMPPSPSPVQAPAQAPLQAPRQGASPAPRPSAIGPTAAVRAHLRGYAGGALEPSAFGASAPHGHGEVHLLAFDPSAGPEAEDPWVQSRVVELVARAWDHRARLAFPHGGADQGGGGDDAIRRALDPNENFRAGLAFSAILLVAYAIVVGPVTFRRASRRAGERAGGRFAPLVHLKWIPLWSAATFAAIVVAGLATKGWRGRARHLSLVELHGGSARGTARHFRGFFASEAGALAVAGAGRSSVLETAPIDDARSSRGVRSFDRGGVILTGLASLPWQTVVVREDTLETLGHGVSFAQAQGDAYAVTNRTGYTLKDVVLHVPGDALRYLTTLDDGETREVSTARALGAGAASLAPQRTETAGSMKVHPLGARDVESMLGGRDGERLRVAWEPLEAAAGDAVDWWPGDEPALLAEIIGVPKPARDSGLAVESARVLLRVVGKGGAP